MRLTKENFLVNCPPHDTRLKSAGLFGLQANWYLVNEAHRLKEKEKGKKKGWGVGGGGEEVHVLMK